MKFLIDMPLPPSLATWLRGQRHDADYAGHIGLARASDSAIIAHAGSSRAIIVTADHDFSRLLMAMAKAETSAILFRGGQFDDAAAFKYMKRALQTLDEADVRLFLMTVDATRVRRRWMS